MDAAYAGMLGATALARAGRFAAAEQVMANPRAGAADRVDAAADEGPDRGVDG